MEVERLKIIDINGRDLLADSRVRNFGDDLITAAVKEIESRRYEAFMGKLKELGIEVDPEVEQHRRFKRFAREITGGEEAIYYNDGSISGMRVITFITKMEPFDPEDFSIKCSVNYY